MKPGKMSIFLLAVTSVLFFSACTGGAKPARYAAGDFVYRGHDFGPNRNEAYKRGVLDGCRTKDGDYTKNHELFNTSIDYHDGWEHGRLHCKAAK